jgi:hypothetical protein
MLTFVITYTLLAHCNVRYESLETLSLIEKRNRRIVSVPSSR